MKRIVTFAFSLFILAGLQAQESDVQHRLPSIDLTTIYGEPFNTSAIENNGNPVIISFWALWCKPCIKELNTIAEVYDDWVEETGVTLYAVSVDDSRSSAKVGPTANGNGWEFEILLDKNQEFKKAMNVNMIPHTFLLDGKGNIVWQHTSFSEGSELELIEKVRKVARGEKPDNTH
ncbi:MAG: TlpA disulfide reductase family protein [Bacteroidales bacterium]|nr:TlpA family protein disulfide reductase [Bacteroidales bacterium]MDD2323442.1 TlpA disulfide reductase family protein [Bacteroidales bacterium]MDD3010797.1 TlpA disulfide reductase family protein [Bacteroidales bacterium]MDD3961220.1 TlpA disulfide reductase family protein [Bacteroidales bacterium]MDY0286122.1 TlpA disulfide reductase family protein [Bacteroidales bacterium]